MTQKYSVSIHDLRISEAEIVVATIKNLLDTFKIPLTLHLVFDEPLEEDSLLFGFLAEKNKSGQIEIVFHGLTHSCSKKVYRWLAFYHKYQAEYLVDSDIHRVETRLMYQKSSNQLGYNLGICPPCWIANRKNLVFFDSLSPVYIETLLHLTTKQRRFFTSAISLGSPNDKEVFFLKIMANGIFWLSTLLKIKRLRIAIHTCDLNKPQSMLFFQRLITSLEKRKLHAVLLKELAQD